MFNKRRNSDRSVLSVQPLCTYKYINTASVHINMYAIKNNIPFDRINGLWTTIYHWYSVITKEVP